MIFARWARKIRGLIQKPLTSLEQIENADHRLVAVSWKGSPCGVVKARILSDIECQAIGNFSLIETEEYKWSRAKVKTSWSELRAVSEKNMAICKASLVSPTYDEIFAIIGKTQFNVEVKAQVEHINKQLQEMPVGPARQELEDIRDSLICAWDVILPADFMAGVIEFALQIHATDIKKVTEDMLYTAAILADRGNDNPHDHMMGAFSAFNIRDIDCQAWMIFDKKVEEAREDGKKRRGVDDAD
jgi:hypothetical protein